MVPDGPVPIMPWAGYSSGDAKAEPKDVRPVRSMVPLPLATTLGPTCVSVTVYIEAWAIPAANSTSAAVMQGTTRRLKDESESFSIVCLQLEVPPLAYRPALRACQEKIMWLCL